MCTFDRRFPVLLIAYFILWLTGIVRAEVLIKPNDSNINYYGRFDFSNSWTSVKFNWPGGRKGSLVRQVVVGAVGVS